MIIALIAGTIGNLPMFATGLDGDTFFGTNFPAIVFGSLIVMFIAQGRSKGKDSLLVFILGVVSITFINLLPEFKESQTLILSRVHLPVFLWLLMGLAYLGTDSRNASSRVSYLRFNGELLMVSTLILIGGFVFSGVTLLLFDQSGINIDWLENYFPIYGFIGAVLVAAFVVDLTTRKFKPITPIIARLFAPLFLLVLVCYLIAIIIQQKTPFEDREFLIVFNFLLILILGITIFSITGRKTSEEITINDYINLGLVIVTVLVNTIILSAIIFRLVSYGITPNRVAVLGANILIFIHLAGIIHYYARFIQGSKQFSYLEQWISCYFNVYFLWSGFVAFGFPFFFWFK